MFRFVCFCLLVKLSTGTSLFNAKDKVKKLDSVSFNSTIPRSSTAWVVLFYASWCGHCQRFAPIWKDLAKDINGWDHTVRVATVACNKYTQLCRQQKIPYVPTIKFFPPNTSVLHQGRRLRPSHSVKDLRHDIIDNVARVPGQAENRLLLQPLRSLSSLWAAVTSQHSAAVFVGDPAVESQRYTALEVALDLFDRLNLGYMWKPTAMRYHLQHTPAIYLVHRNGNTELVAMNKSRSEFVDALRIRALGEYVTISPVHPTSQSTILREIWLEEQTHDYGPSDNVTSAQTNFSAAFPTVKSSGIGGLHRQDLESCVHYALWHEVGQRAYIEGDSMKALKGFLEVLAKFYPGHGPTKEFLVQTNDWLKTYTQLRGEEWVAHITANQTEEAYVPERIDWKGCAGSKPVYRGYPCSLWMTFHSLTVGAARLENNNTFKEAHVNGSEVLFAMRNYVINFFGCRECADNFDRRSHSIADVKSHGDAALWLWWAHNQANNHLQGDPTEDPAHPKIQFPSRQACAQCYNASEWDTVQVFGYLNEFYGENYIIEDMDPYTFVPITNSSYRRSYH